MPNQPQLIKITNHYVLKFHRPGRNMNETITTTTIMILNAIIERL